MRAWFVCFGLLVSTSALAQEYRPDFDCSHANAGDSIAQLLCHDSEAAKHELIFDQTYYALRQIVGKQGWKALKQEAIADDDHLKECVATTPATEGAPSADAGCYIRDMDAITAKYKARLSGAALEEANRSLDDHIALQKKLVDLGYLPTGTIADGVYGEGTRTAIATWQRVSRRPENGGFISNADADALSLDKEVATSPPSLSPASTSANNDTQPPSSPSDAIYSLCGGAPQKEQIALAFNDPYATKGKCYEIWINSRFGSIQWINSQTLLIIETLPYGPAQTYSTIVNDPNGHLALGKTAIVIGGEPVSYQTAIGSQAVAPSFTILKYLN
ncbi:peptidoglycan-binding domain-containing protein [Kozakia baliensis]|uniref:peptidoglycan-binding domain-containing protein n=1 Tax=Kozakia baliensis TaxID=153496 RepID=UPI00345B8941